MKNKYIMSENVLQLSIIIELPYLLAYYTHPRIGRTQILAWEI